VTKITGGDGVVRDMLKIPGEYRGKQGVFEFINIEKGTDLNGTYLALLGCPFFRISVRSAWRARVSSG